MFKRHKINHIRQSLRQSIEAISEFLIVVVLYDAVVDSPCASEVEVISVVDMNVVSALVVSSSILGVVQKPN